jgi:hypothetical protein
MKHCSTLYVVSGCPKESIAVAHAAKKRDAGTRVRRKGRADAAFWRSAAWLPAEAARAADRFAGIGPTDATLPIRMETALSMARLLAEVNACAGTPQSRLRPYSLDSTNLSALRGSRNQVGGPAPEKTLRAYTTVYAEFWSPRITRTWSAR